MQRLGHMMRHLRLLRRMGKEAGVDLAAAYRAGALSQDEWAEMVQGCRACDWAAECPGWLDSHPDIGSAPVECRNRARLAALKPAFPAGGRT